jgi:small subunit ribosomal protein S18
LIPEEDEKLDMGDESASGEGAPPADTSDAAPAEPIAAAPTEAPAEGTETPTAEAEAPAAVAEPVVGDAPDGAPAQASDAVADGRAAEAPTGEERPRGRPGGGGRPERPGGDDRRRRRFGRRKVCGFCVDKAKEIDYKDPVKLRRYLSDRARIEPRRKTGTCAKHQRWLGTALKRARHLALLPYTPEHIRVTGVFPSRK